jgi:hypothetical protein
MNDLKPCPFCGGKAEFHSHYVMCLKREKCGATMTPCGDCAEETVIAAWNRRTDADGEIDNTSHETLSREA